MHLFKIDSIQCYPWHFAGTACLTLFFFLLPLTTKLNSAREKITIMSIHRPCIVCTDWAAVKEQRVQWHPAENEWEKVLEWFEQGQKQSHHQVRHIYRMHKYMHSIKNFVLYGKYIVGGGAGEIDTSQWKLNLYAFFQVSHWRKDQNQWDESKLVGLKKKKR